MEHLCYVYGENKMRTQMQTYTGGRIAGGQEAGFDLAKLNVLIPKESEQTKASQKYQQKSLNTVQKSMETTRCKNRYDIMGASQGNMECGRTNWQRHEGEQKPYTQPH